MNAPRPRMGGASAAVAVADSTEPARPRKPLGQLLVERGALSADDKLRTLAMQAEVEARLGDILIAHGLLHKDELLRTIASQFDTAVADFSHTPPDISLIEAIGAERCVALGVLPWQRRQGGVLVASARPEQFHLIRAELEDRFGCVEMVITSELELHKAVLRNHPRSLAARAETRTPLRDSCRTWSGRGRWTALWVALAALGIGLATAPKALFFALLGWTLFTLAALTALKVAAWIVQARAEARVVQPDTAGPSIRLPTISILVPLYKEREIAERLVQRLSRLDYPRELLDVCLVVESDDLVTAEVLDRAELPSFMRRIVVPAAGLKTKPRALNYALDFCRGSIVGVYDAEDAPAPDQLRRVAEHFHQAPPEVVCLQGVLDYYNAHANWIARCFTIEYAAWFRVILPGFLRLGLVIPLGGTTLFFRRQVLEALGGWDAHNVTEDADLGIRLARRGYRVELLNTVTAEEANCRLWPWVKQRSRWLKGYAVTWAVHNRNPRQLWRDLGPWRFIGLQLLLLGTLTQFAVAPALWSFWLIALGVNHAVMTDLGGAAVWAIAILFITGEAASIAIRVAGVRRTGHHRLMRWVPTLYLYFPLATLAAYKAGVELITRPFYWDKTAHGQRPRRAAPPTPEFRSRRHQA